MKKTFARIFNALKVPFIFIGIIWIIKILETIFSVSWVRGGILPRHTQGLKGIITSPLLHGDFAHLISNTGPLLVLGWCLFYFYRRYSWTIVTSLWLLSGLFTWIIGREAWHIGASGLIYAIASFLFFSGIFRRYFPLLIISLLVAVLYGGLIWGLLPTSGYISWEGHLSGAVAGYIIAWSFRKKKLDTVT